MGVDIVPLLSHDALIFGPELIRSEAHIMAQAVTARPSTPAIRQTRLLIDNQWVDPVEGGTFETYNPAMGEVIARGRRGERPPTSIKRSRPRAGARIRPLEHDGRRRPRPAPLRAGRPRRAERRRARRARVAERRQDDRRLAGRPARGGQHAPLLRRLGRQDRGPDRPGPGQLPLVHPAPAGRRGRPDHPLELPAADARLEVGPGAGLRQHHRA